MLQQDFGQIFQIPFKNKANP